MTLPGEGEKQACPWVPSTSPRGWTPLGGTGSCSSFLEDSQGLQSTARFPGSAVCGVADRTSPDSAKMTQDVETIGPQGKRTRGSQKPDLPCSGSWCRRGARAAVHTRGRPACSGRKGSSLSTGPVTVSRGSRPQFALPSTSPVTLSSLEAKMPRKSKRERAGGAVTWAPEGPGGAAVPSPGVLPAAHRPRQHPQWSHPVTA